MDRMAAGLPFTKKTALQSVNWSRIGTWSSVLFVLWVLSGFLFPNIRPFFPSFGDCAYALRHGCVTLPDVLLHLVCLTFLGVVVISYVRGRGWGAGAGGATLYLYILCGAVSILFDYRYRNEVLPLSSTVTGAAICGIACFLVLREDVRKLYNLMIMLMTVHGLCAIWLYVTERPDRYFYSGTVHRAGGLFYSPTILYPLLLCVFFLAFGQGMVSRSRLQKIGSFFAATVLFVALFLTCYRGGMLGLLTALAALFLVFRHQRPWQRAALLVLPVVLLCTICTFCLRVEGPRNAASSARSIGGRFELFKIGVRTYSQSPIVGHGIGSVRLYRPGDKVANAYQRSWFYPHPHNQLLQWMIEMGVFGVLFWLGVHVQIGAVLLTKRPDPWRAIAACSLLALSVSWMTDVSVDASTSVENTLIFFVLFCALALKDGRSEDAVDANEPSGSSPQAKPVFWESRKSPGDDHA
jgi:O-antigen ligase